MRMYKIINKRDSNDDAFETNRQFRVVEVSSRDIKYMQLQYQYILKIHFINKKNTIF